MRLVTLAFVMAIACSPANAPSSATPASPASTAALPTVSLGATPTAAAGDVRGDHALVSVIVDSGSNGGGSNTIWDVPLDGGAPRSLVAYTRAELPWDRRQPLTVFPLDLTKQLSPDGRRLVLSDAADVAGRGLLIIDLLAGSSRMIATPDSPDEPVWSLDGQRIAYRGYALQGTFQKESGLWVVDAGGGVPRQVWKSDVPAGANETRIYSWTEDGSGLVVERDYPEFSVIDVTSGTTKRMSAAVNGLAIRAKRPAVVIARNQDVALPSPTDPPGAGGSISRPGEVEIRDTALATGRVVYRHEDVGTLLQAPRWNPKSDEVLFHWACGAGVLSCRQELVVVDALSQSRRVLPTATLIYSASWNADGTRILYSDLTAVRLVNADGTGDRELFRPAPVAGSQQPYVSGIVPFAPR
jgi:dipeptidyl aminopeptidase/acylaminoacyl peptidase